MTTATEPVLADFSRKWSVFDAAVEYRESGGHNRAFRDDLPAGASQWSEGQKSLSFMYPCGCGCVHAVPIKPFQGNGWDWDGNIETPTLTPSLGLYPRDGKASDGSGYHWHGYLTAGVFKPC
jgi:hypothetical protein